jgi:hypothetical protein
MIQKGLKIELFYMHINLMVSSLTLQKPLARTCKSSYEQLKLFAILLWKISTQITINMTHIPFCKASFPRYNHNLLTSGYNHFKEMTKSMDKLWLIRHHHTCYYQWSLYKRIVDHIASCKDKLV